MSHRYCVGDWQLHNRTGPDLVFPTNSVVAHNSVFPKRSRSLIWEYLSWLLRKGATKRETSFSFPSVSALDLHCFLSSPIRNPRSLQLTAALRCQSVSLGKACGWERFSKKNFLLSYYYNMRLRLWGSFNPGQNIAVSVWGKCAFLQTILELIAYQLLSWIPEVFYTHLARCLGFGRRSSAKDGNHDNDSTETGNRAWKASGNLGN